MPSLNHRRTVKTKPLFSALAAGLVLSQIVATVFVYRSNTALAQKMAGLHREGYLVVPGLATLPPIESFKAAFGGGLFYTLSVGAALSLLSMAAAWLYIHLFKQHRYSLVLYLLVWAVLLYAVNANGLSFIAGLFFVLVPACVYTAAVKVYRQAAGGMRMAVRILPLVAVATTAIFWTTQLNDRLFLNIRDYFLLSNPVGTGISDFYYRYTLFAAEPFKSLSQKTLHTCDVSGLKNPDLRRRVENRLRSYDYLPIKGSGAAELTISPVNGKFAFGSNGREVFQAEADEFFSGTARLLALFSEKTDRYAFFRSFTFYGILFAFPLLLFAAVYGLLRGLTGFFLSPASATLVSAFVCLLLGTAPILALQPGGSQPIGPDKADIYAALDSGPWRQRVAALRTIEQQGLEISELTGYRTLLKASRVPVRYWSARALSVSRQPQTIEDLLQLLHDPQPIVVCQALYALGKRQSRSSIAAVVNTVNRSTSWYVQQYAYRALRSLGWKQPVLN